MKNSILVINDLPKSFDLSYAPDYIQPLTEGMRTEEILYDIYPAPADEKKGEDSVVLFKYNESATGIRLLHAKKMQTMVMELSNWASDADVQLYADFINALVAKHKRACLHDTYDSMQGLTDKDVIKMQRERRTYLKRQLTKKNSFTMEGIRGDLLVTKDDLVPWLPLDEQIPHIQRYFVELQWKE